MPNNKLLVLLATTLVTLTLSTNAVLAETSYLPTFSPNQEVYIDPKLDRVDAAVDLAGLQEKLKKLEQEHGLEFAFIASQNTNQTDGSNNEQVAQLGLARILNRWSGQQDFPKANYVVIYWLRRGDNVRKGTFLGDAGTELNKEYDINASFFTDASSSILPQYMPTDPAGAALEYFKQVNHKIQAIKNMNEFIQGLPMLAKNMFFILLPIGSAYYLLYKLFAYITKYRSAKTESEELFKDIAEFNLTTCDQVQRQKALLEALELEHNNTIKLWADKAKGDYQLLLQVYNELSHKFVLLAEIFKEAENLQNKPFKLVYLLKEQQFNYDSEINSYLDIMQDSLNSTVGYQLRNITYKKLKQSIYTANQHLETQYNQVRRCLNASAELENAKKDLQECLDKLLLSTLEIGTAHMLLNDYNNKCLSLEANPAEPYTTLEQANKVRAVQVELEQLIKEIHLQLAQNTTWRRTVIGLTSRHKLMAGYEQDTAALSSIKLINSMLDSHESMLRNAELTQAKKLYAEIQSHIEGWETFLNEVRYLNKNMNELSEQVHQACKTLEQSTLPEKQEYITQLAKLNNKLADASTDQSFNNQLDYMKYKEEFVECWRNAVNKLAEHNEREAMLHKLRKRVASSAHSFQRSGVKSRTKTRASRLEEDILLMNLTTSLNDLKRAELDWENTINTANKEHESYSSSSSSYSSYNNNDSYGGGDYSSSSYGGGDFGGGSFGGGSY